MTENEKINGSIVRWRDFHEYMDKFKRDVKHDNILLQAEQKKTQEEQKKLAVSFASMKTELRILATILLAALATIITLFLRHIMAVGP